MGFGNLTDGAVANNTRKMAIMRATFASKVIVIHELYDCGRGRARSYSGYNIITIVCTVHWQFDIYI